MRHFLQSTGRTSLTINSVTKKCLANAGSFTKTLSKFKKTSYQSIYYDHHTLNDHDLMDNFTTPCFERLLSMVCNRTHRLVIPVARSVLNIIFKHDNIAHYDLTVITKTGLENHGYTDLKSHPHPMYSATESVACQKMLKDYNLLSATKPGLRMGENSNECEDEYVDAFVNSCANVDDVLFIVLRLKDQRKSEYRKVKEPKSKIPSTRYIDEESTSILDKILSRHKLRIDTYLGQNVPRQSLANWKSSYSLMYALDDGFAMKVFSKSHKYAPSEIVIHSLMGLRIILKRGMVLMWHYSLVHCGAKSLTTIDGNHLASLRLFQYIWRESCHSRRSNTKVEDSTDLHREQTTICRSFHDDTVTCEKCNNSVEDIIDLRNYTSQKNCGDVILGDLDNLGWIVVEGNKLTNNVMSDIVAIVNNGGDNKNKWHRIGNNQERYQKFNSTMDKDKFYLLAKSHTKQF